MKLILYLYIGAVLSIYDVLAATVDRSDPVNPSSDEEAGKVLGVNNTNHHVTTGVSAFAYLTPFTQKDVGSDEPIYIPPTPVLKLKTTDNPLCDELDDYMKLGLVYKGANDTYHVSFMAYFYKLVEQKFFDSKISTALMDELDRCLSEAEFHHDYNFVKGKNNECDIMRYIAYCVIVDKLKKTSSEESSEESSEVDSEEIPKYEVPTDTGRYYEVSGAPKIQVISKPDKVLTDCEELDDLTDKGYIIVTNEEEGQFTVSPKLLTFRSYFRGKIALGNREELEKCYTATLEGFNLKTPECALIKKLQKCENPMLLATNKPSVVFLEEFINKLDSTHPGLKSKELELCEELKFYVVNDLVLINHNNGNIWLDVTALRDAAILRHAIPEDVSSSYTSCLNYFGSSRFDSDKTRPCTIMNRLKKCEKIYANIMTDTFIGRISRYSGLNKIPVTSNKNCEKLLAFARDEYLSINEKTGSLIFNTRNLYEGMEGFKNLPYPLVRIHLHDIEKNNTIKFSEADPCEVYELIVNVPEKIMRHLKTVESNSEFKNMCTELKTLVRNGCVIVPAGEEKSYTLDKRALFPYLMFSYKNITHLHLQLIDICYNELGEDQKNGCDFAKKIVYCNNVNVSIQSQYDEYLSNPSVNDNSKEQCRDFKKLYDLNMIEPNKPDGEVEYHINGERLATSWNEQVAKLSPPFAAMCLDSIDVPLNYERPNRFCQLMELINNCRQANQKPALDLFYSHLSSFDGLPVSNPSKLNLASVVLQFIRHGLIVKEPISEKLQLDGIRFPTADYLKLNPLLARNDLANFIIHFADGDTFLPKYDDICASNEFFRLKNEDDERFLDVPDENLVLIDDLLNLETITFDLNRKIQLLTIESDQENNTSRLLLLLWTNNEINSYKMTPEIENCLKQLERPSVVEPPNTAQVYSPFKYLENIIRCAQIDATPSAEESNVQTADENPCLDLAPQIQQKMVYLGANNTAHINIAQAFKTTIGSNSDAPKKAKLIAYECLINLIKAPPKGGACVLKVNINRCLGLLNSSDTLESEPQTPPE